MFGSFLVPLLPVPLDSSLRFRPCSSLSVLLVSSSLLGLSLSSLYLNLLSTLSSQLTIASLNQLYTAQPNISVLIFTTCLTRSTPARQSQPPSTPQCFRPDKLLLTYLTQHSQPPGVSFFRPPDCKFLCYPVLISTGSTLTWPLLLVLRHANSKMTCLNPL